MIIGQRKILYFIKNKIFSLIIIFISLIFLSNILPQIFFGDEREFQLLEIIQNSILIYILFLNFQFRKQFLKVSNLFTFLIRQSFILFILYEELSFITYSSNNLNNYNGEFNLHNSNILSLRLFSFTIPNTNLTSSISLLQTLYLLVILILSYGSYFSFFKQIRYFFLEKKYAFYTTSIYVANLIYTAILFDFNPYPIKVYPINEEILELLFYLLICIDTLQKRKIISKNKLLE